MELYKEIFKLKNLLRRGWLIRNACEKVGRYESDAEHCFSMAILAMEIMHKEQLNLDQAKVLKMILVHELGEIEAGDITPHDNVPAEVKYQKELNCITNIAFKSCMGEILHLWLEFEENITPEAQFVKKIDKLDAVMQSKVYSNINENDDIFNEFYNNSKDLFKGYEKYIYDDQPQGLE